MYLYFQPELPLGKEVQRYNFTITWILLKLQTILWFLLSLSLLFYLKLLTITSLLLSLLAETNPLQSPLKRGLTILKYSAYEKQNLSKFKKKCHNALNV